MYDRYQVDAPVDPNESAQPVEHVLDVASSEGYVRYKGARYQR